ncbi:MAG: bifunctional precorrin-2 dehydrogenase/sirohydrochlorin ferrochelatase [Deltaproteobacteria bacterium]|jgi:precorrin-2 dehydrogenase/sirohydrochlorin ferrochelatase|nr:bifunctional precorrin-2 dehydrogenase/sirohydrochlorin ferrochelatase [Deltaproteobacteria bacterium]
MGLLSINLNFEGRWALLIGAGAVGRRKLGALLAAGAKVRVVEPRPAPWLLDLAAEGLTLLEKSFSESFLADEPLVFVATPLNLSSSKSSSNEISQEISLEDIINLALKKGLWVNVASDPARSNFFLPALAQDGSFQVAVSTGGASPALAARVARELKETYAGYGFFCRLLGRVRPLVLASDLSSSERRRIFKDLAADAELARLVNQKSLNQDQERAVLERLGHLLAPLRLPGDFAP